MSFFDEEEFDSAEPGQNSYFCDNGKDSNGKSIPGTYKVRIKRCKEGKTRKELKYFLAECEVLESDVKRYPVGSKVTWFMGVKKDTPALGNIREFIGIAMNEPLEAVNGDVGKLVVSKEQPLAGTIMKAIAINEEKQKSEGEFTRVTWTLIEMSDASKAAKAA